LQLVEGGREKDADLGHIQEFTESRRGVCYASTTKLWLCEESPPQKSNQEPLIGPFSF
jgi:hypothetical protein